MRIVRRFTRAGEDAYQDIAFGTTNSEIRNPDGSVVFQAKDIEIPKAWSQVAADVLAQKYFRKRGVPARQSASTQHAPTTGGARQRPSAPALQLPTP